LRANTGNFHRITIAGSRSGRRPSRSDEDGFDKG
jgi:hypothetical protein